MTDIRSVILGGLLALLGVMISSLLQLFGNSRTHKQLLDRDATAYVRHVADAKRERLIRRYETASHAAEAYFSLSRQMMFISKDELPSLAEMDRAAFDELQDVKAYLALEDDTADTIKLCDQLQSEFMMYKQGVKQGEFKNEKLDAAIVALRDAIKLHLKALENPVLPLVQAGHVRLKANSKA